MTSRASSNPSVILEAEPQITNPAAALRATISRFGPQSVPSRMEVRIEAFSFGSPPLSSEIAQGSSPISSGVISDSLTLLPFHSETLVLPQRDNSSRPSPSCPFPCTDQAFFLPNRPKISAKGEVKAESNTPTN